MLLFISIVRCALDYKATYDVNPLDDSRYSLTTKNGNVVVARDAKSILRIIPDDSDDGAELTLNGEGICIYDDTLEVCGKAKRAKFRIKQKRNGYRIKTETRGLFSKLLLEKCLTMISGKPRLRKCSLDKDEQIFLFKKQYNKREEGREFKRRPQIIKRRPQIVKKSFREKEYTRDYSPKEDSTKEDSSKDDFTNKDDSTYKDEGLKERNEKTVNNGLKRCLPVSPCVSPQVTVNVMRRALSNCNPQM
ncbi:hypothetical protein GINT2_001729 [Glugoides intestinalis]